MHAAMYATEWFMTLFTRSYPVALTARVMDCFLSEGFKMVYRVALALLQTVEKEALAADMGGMMMLLTKALPARVAGLEGAVMAKAFAFNLKQAEIRDAHDQLAPRT